MINETSILIKRPSCGYYVRWYYNGFHYWNFLSDQESLLTEGEKYNTTGKTKVRLYSGQLTTSDIGGLWPLMRAKDVAVYTSSGWKTLLIDPGTLIVHNNTIGAYEFEVSATIGTLQETLVIPEPPVIYATPPMFVSAEVGNVASDILVLRFNHVLQIVTPATGDFTPSFSGGAVSVSNVAITDLGGYYYVYLTLSRVIVFGETGTIQYTPGVNKLIGVAPYNAYVYSFTESVTNNVADLVAPAVTSVEVIDDVITITLDKAQDQTITPSLTSFIITFSGGDPAVTFIDLYPNNIYLKLDRVIIAGETGNITYDPALVAEAQKYRGIYGALIAYFDQAITNLS